MNTKEIHVHTNIKTCPTDALNDYVGMINVIAKEQRAVVHTTQIAILSDVWWYLDNGVRIFIHNNGKVLEVKEGMDGTNKDIRRGHNIMRLLLGHCFGDIC